MSVWPVRWPSINKPLIGCSLIVLWATLEPKQLGVASYGVEISGNMWMDRLEWLTNSRQHDKRRQLEKDYYIRHGRCWLDLRCHSRKATLSSDYTPSCEYFSAMLVYKLPLHMLAASWGINTVAQTQIESLSHHRCISLVGVISKLLHNRFGMKLNYTPSSVWRTLLPCSSSTNMCLIITGHAIYLCCVKDTHTLVACINQWPSLYKLLCINPLANNATSE